MIKKKCPNCGKIAEFYRRSATGDGGYSWQCKDCENIRLIKYYWRKKGKEATEVRIQNLQKTIKNLQSIKWE